MVTLRGDHLLKFNFMEDKSKGLGDSIEKFTTITGIKSLNQVLAKKLEVIGIKSSCGCDKRKEALNKKFPYKK